MIIKNVGIWRQFVELQAFLDNLLDEVAFAGKSNVGYSINALMNRKSLARTSSPAGENADHKFLQCQ